MTSSIQSELSSFQNDFYRDLVIKEVEDINPKSSSAEAQQKSVDERVQKISSDVFCVDKAIILDLSTAKPQAEQRLKEILVVAGVALCTEVFISAVVTFIALGVLGVVPLAFIVPTRKILVAWFVLNGFYLFKKFKLLFGINLPEEEAIKKLCLIRSLAFEAGWSALSSVNKPMPIHQQEIEYLFKREVKLWLMLFRACKTPDEKGAISLLFIKGSQLLNQCDPDLLPKDKKLLAALKQAQKSASELFNMYDQDLGLISKIQSNELFHEDDLQRDEQIKLATKALTYAHEDLLRNLERLEPFCECEIEAPRVLA